jgi:hypothetical protein
VGGHLLLGAVALGVVVLQKLVELDERLLQLAVFALEDFLAPLEDGVAPGQGRGGERAE